MKIVRLENGAENWLLFGGYETAEQFHHSDMHLGDSVTFQLYEHMAKNPSNEVVLKLVSKDGEHLHFANCNSDMRVKRTGDLTWLFTFIHEGKVYLPTFNKNIGKLEDLLNEVKRESRFAVCLEGEESGKIVKVVPNDYAWVVRWIHNDEQAFKQMNNVFALIDNETISAIKNH